jgi:hypothetical protein
LRHHHPAHAIYGVNSIAELNHPAGEFERSIPDILAVLVRQRIVFTSHALTKSIDDAGETSTELFHEIRSDGLAIAKNAMRPRFLIPNS